MLYTTISYNSDFLRKLSYCMLNCFPHVSEVPLHIIRPFPGPLPSNPTYYFTKSLCPSLDDLNKAILEYRYSTT